MNTAMIRARVRSGRSVTFTVRNGDTVDDIAFNMAGVGLITDQRLFKIQERFSEYQGMEQPGTYELSTAMTPEEMLAIMAGGASDAQGDGDTAQDSAESGEDDTEELIPLESEETEEGTDGD